MNRILITPLFLIVLLALWSCGNDSLVVEEPVQPASVSDETGRKPKFRMPDTLDKRLLVVAFYERPLRCNSVIMYDNASHTSAVKISYFNDGTNSTENLEPEAGRGFKVGGADEHYRLSDRKVQYSRHSGVATYTASYDITN